MRLPAKLFYSYSTRDELLRRELDAHLAALQHDNVLAPWGCRDIAAGAEWDREIRTALDDADIILLLISADFLNSTYISSVELSRSLARHRTGEAIVVPIILRPCDWKTQQFATLQALPTNGKPVTKTRPRDDAWTDVATGIRRMITVTAVTAVTAPVRQLSLGDFLRVQMRLVYDSVLADQSDRRSNSEPATLARVTELADTFVTHPPDARMVAAREVSDLASDLSLSAVLQLALSEHPGERIAAGIALRELVTRDNGPANRGIVMQVIRIGLRDSHARVRYRFLEVAMVLPEVLSCVGDILRPMAVNDTDDVVRETAVKMLAEELPSSVTYLQRLSRSM